MVTTLRWGCGLLIVILGIWLYLRDLRRSIRRARRDFPGVNIVVAVKGTDVGRDFWVGLAAVVLGLLLLPLR